MTAEWIKCRIDRAPHSAFQEREVWWWECPDCGAKGIPSDDELWVAQGWRYHRLEKHGDHSD